MTRAFTTRLRVTEDERDVDGILRIKFELLRSVSTEGFIVLASLESSPGLG